MKGISLSIVRNHPKIKKTTNKRKIKHGKTYREFSAVTGKIVEKKTRFRRSKKEKKIIPAKKIKKRPCRKTRADNREMRKAWRNYLDSNQQYISYVDFVKKIRKESPKTAPEIVDPISSQPLELSRGIEEPKAP